MQEYTSHSAESKTRCIFFTANHERRHISSNAGTPECMRAGTTTFTITQALMTLAIHKQTLNQNRMWQQDLE